MDLSKLSRHVVLSPLLALTAVWACSGKVETDAGRKPVSTDPDPDPLAPCTGSGCGGDAGAPLRPRDEDAGPPLRPRDSGRPDYVPECTIDPATHAVVLDREDFCSRQWFGTDCDATIDTVLEGYTCSAPATETEMTRAVGCGMISVAMNGGYTGTTYHFDEATGELVGMEYFTDVATGPCDTGSFRWGHGPGPCFDVKKQGCLRVPPTRDAGKPTPPPVDADAGRVTPCNGTGDDAPCLAAGATCWDEPWTVAPCAELFDPLCACPGGACACWGKFGMDGPPYPDSPASTCESTEDTTTCASASALCSSVHANLADHCSEFAGPVCDCDDHPCRCWADERSRISR